MPRKRKDADADVTRERVEAYVRQSSAATRRPPNLADEQIPKENRRGRHGRGWLSRSIGRVADLAVFGLWIASGMPEETRSPRATMGKKGRGAKIPTILARTASRDGSDPLQQSARASSRAPSKSPKEFTSVSPKSSNCPTSPQFGMSPQLHSVSQFLEQNAGSDIGLEEELRLHIDYIKRYLHHAVACEEIKNERWRRAEAERTWRQIEEDEVLPQEMRPLRKRKDDSDHSSASPKHDPANVDEDYYSPKSVRARRMKQDNAIDDVDSDGERAVLLDAAKRKAVAEAAAAEAEAVLRRRVARQASRQNQHVASTGEERRAEAGANDPEHVPRRFADATRAMGSTDAEGQGALSGHADGRQGKAGKEKEAVFSRIRHRRYEDVMEILEAHRIDIETRDEFGNTLLMLAAQTGSKRMCKILMRNGASLATQNLRGQTVLHFCYAFNYGALGEYLKSKGADDTLLNQFGLDCYSGLEPLSRAGSDSAPAKPTDAPKTVRSVSFCEDVTKGQEAVAVDEDTKDAKGLMREEERGLRHDEEVLAAKRELSWCRSDVDFFAEEVTAGGEGRIESALNTIEKRSTRRTDEHFSWPPSRDEDRFRSPRPPPLVASRVEPVESAAVTAAHAASSQRSGRDTVVISALEYQRLKALATPSAASVRVVGDKAVLLADEYTRLSDAAVMMQGRVTPCSTRNSPVVLSQRVSAAERQPLAMASNYATEPGGLPVGSVTDSPAKRQPYPEHVGHHVSGDVKKSSGADAQCQAKMDSCHTLQNVEDGPEDEENILNISSDTDTTLNNTGNSSPFSALSRESREPTPRMGDSVAAASPVSPTHVSAKRDSVKKSSNSTFNLLAWSNQDKASVSPKSTALPPTVGSGKRSTLLTTLIESRTFPVTDADQREDGSSLCDVANSPTLRSASPGKAPWPLLGQEGDQDGSAVGSLDWFLSRRGGASLDLSSLEGTDNISLSSELPGVAQNHVFDLCAGGIEVSVSPHASSHEEALGLRHDGLPSSSSREGQKGVAGTEEEETWQVSPVDGKANDGHAYLDGHMSLSGCAQTKVSPQPVLGKQPSDEPELAARVRRSRSPVEKEVSHGKRWVPVKLHWRNSPEVTPKTTPTASPRKGISALTDPPADTVDAQSHGDASCKLSPVANLLSSSPPQESHTSCASLDLKKELGKLKQRDCVVEDTRHNLPLLDRVVSGSFVNASASVSLVSESAQATPGSAALAENVVPTAQQDQGTAKRGMAPGEEVAALRAQWVAQTFDRDVHVESNTVNQVPMASTGKTADSSNGDHDSHRIPSLLPLEGSSHVAPILNEDSVVSLQEPVDLARIFLSRAEMGPPKPPSPSFLPPSAQLTSRPPPFPAFVEPRTTIVKSVDLIRKYERYTRGKTPELVPRSPSRALDQVRESQSFPNWPEAKEEALRDIASHRKDLEKALQALDVSSRVMHPSVHDELQHWMETLGETISLVDWFRIHEKELQARWCSLGLSLDLDVVVRIKEAAVDVAKHAMRVALTPSDRFRAQMEQARLIQQKISSEQRKAQEEEMKLRVLKRERSDAGQGNADVSWQDEDDVEEEADRERFQEERIREAARERDAEAEAARISVARAKVIGGLDSAIHFAFRCHQFAGGFDAEASRLFDALQEAQQHLGADDDASSSNFFHMPHSGHRSPVYWTPVLSGAQV